MTKVFEFTDTDETNWENKCSEWAVAGVEFHLYGVTENHFGFCKELCSQHNYLFRYEFRQGLSVAVFYPVTKKNG